MGDAEVESLRGMVRDVVEHTLTRYGFRVQDGPNAMQEENVFLRQLRLANPIQRLERIEVQMAEHEKLDQVRQREILDALKEARDDRETVKREVSDVQTQIMAVQVAVGQTIENKFNEIMGREGPIEDIRKQNRNALIALIGVLISSVGTLLIKFVL